MNSYGPQMGPNFESSSLLKSISVWVDNVARKSQLSGISIPLIYYIYNFVKVQAKSLD